MSEDYSHVWNLHTYAATQMRLVGLRPSGKELCSGIMHHYR